VADAGPPAAHGHKLLAQPACGALPPAARPPRPAGQGLQPLIGPLGRACRLPLGTHPEVDPHPDDVAFLPCFQACQEMGVVPIVGIGHDATVRHSPGPGLIEPRQRDLGRGLKRHLRGHAGFAPALGSLGPRLRQG
jgi:hypothetical protein